MGTRLRSRARTRTRLRGRTPRPDTAAARARAPRGAARNASRGLYGIDARRARARGGGGQAHDRSAACRRDRPGRPRSRASRPDRGARRRHGPVHAPAARIRRVQGLASHERLQAHRRLAELTDEPFGRARHLALSADEPDAELASELERARPQLPTAARRSWRPSSASTRSASRPKAIGPMPIGGRPGPRGPPCRGESARARVLAEDLVARASPGVEQARALFLMAAVETEDLQASVSILEQALPRAASDPELAARIHCELSNKARSFRGLRVAEGHARAAVVLAEGLDDHALRATALDALRRSGSTRPSPARSASRRRRTR